eukprot:jgi/Mesvir1/7681/Mv11651-RA.1
MASSSSPTEGHGKKRRLTSTNGTGKLVELSVGGQVYATTLDTLCKDKGSMLAAMFSGTFPLCETSDGHYFIDRDGQRFRHVLNYLRTGTVHLPSENAIQMCEELLEEAEFFILDGLQKLLEERLQNEMIKAEQLEQDRLKSVRAAGYIQDISGALYNKADLELQRRRRNAQLSNGAASAGVRAGLRRLALLGPAYRQTSLIFLYIFTLATDLVGDLRGSISTDARQVITAIVVMQYKIHVMQYLVCTSSVIDVHLHVTAINLNSWSEHLAFMNHEGQAFNSLRLRETSMFMALGRTASIVGQQVTFANHNSPLTTTTASAYKRAHNPKISSGFLVGLTDIKFSSNDINATRSLSWGLKRHIWSEETKVHVLSGQPDPCPIVLATSSAWAFVRATWVPASLMTLSVTYSHVLRSGRTGTWTDFAFLLPAFRQHSATFPHGMGVLLPPSALDRLAMLHIEYPMLFEVTNAGANRRTHCGVLEFVADEGLVYMPYWMMENLLLQEGDIVTFKSATLPKGTYVKLQPHTKDFLDISNPKAVLEMALRSFGCLTKGDCIKISYNNRNYIIDIVDTKPADAVSIVETDCEVDFAPPLDFVEPAPPPPPSLAPPVPVGTKKDDPPPPAEEKEDSFKAFTGSGFRLDGKRVASAPMPVPGASRAEAKPPNSSSVTGTSAGSRPGSASSSRQGSATGLNSRLSPSPSFGLTFSAGDPPKVPTPGSSAPVCGPNKEGIPPRYVVRIRKGYR